MRAMTGPGAERNLRRVLVADAAASAAAALAGVVLAGPIAELLEVPTASVWVVAAALVPWAIALVELSRSEREALVRYTPLVVAANAAWVLATAALLATGVIDRAGWWLPVPMALAVGELGLTQWLLWRSVAQRSATPAGLATS